MKTGGCDQINPNRSKSSSVHWVPLNMLRKVPRGNVSLARWKWTTARRPSLCRYTRDDPRLRRYLNPSRSNALTNSRAATFLSRLAKSCGRLIPLLSVSPLPHRPPTDAAHRSLSYPPGRQQERPQGQTAPHLENSPKQRTRAVPQSKRSSGHHPPFRFAVGSQSWSPSLPSNDRGPCGRRQPAPPNPMTDFNGSRHYKYQTHCPQTLRNTR